MAVLLHKQTVRGCLQETGTLFTLRALDVTNRKVAVMLQRPGLSLKLPSSGTRSAALAQGSIREVKPQPRTVPLLELQLYSRASNALRGYKPYPAVLYYEEHLWQMRD